jgi:site-specific DNA-methyltransferase (adenine-specific)
MINPDTIHLGDCLELLPEIEDKSIDMILCDLPYGVTACDWDSIIPLEPLWEQYKRIIKDNGAIVLTATQPFTTDLINSNRKMFKYEMIWEKTRKTGFQMATKRPMREHENVLIFYKSQSLLNQDLIKLDKPKRSGIKSKSGSLLNEMKMDKDRMQLYTNYKTSIIKINNEDNSFHPTQKPVKLFEYLILTYTNEGDTVLDNCMGSGTTAIACIRTQRHYIGMEKEKKYYDITNQRIEKEKEQLTLFD